MLKMMRACLGENVTPEYAPLMREEMGFIARDVRWAKQPASEQLQAAARPDRRRRGFAPSRLASRLAGFGIPYTIVEKNDETRRQPGTSTGIRAAASITPNHSYSFSFGARNNWTVISRSAKSYWTISRRSRSNMTFAATSASNTRLTSSRWEQTRRR